MEYLHLFWILADIPDIDGIDDIDSSLIVQKQGTSPYANNKSDTGVLGFSGSIPIKCGERPVAKRLWLNICFLGVSGD